MNHSIKAALWSALVLPGLGQITMKRYISGVLFALISITVLSVIVAKVLTIADQIIQGSVEMGLAGIVGAVTQSTLLSDIQTVNIAFVIYLMIWLLSILDAYRVGNMLDKMTPI
jgi:hypothetical protein